MNLFDSFQIRDISFRNRIAVSPMCEYSSEDGFANDWHLV
jgi:2,4-dienoyl-CoA reductase-like NADH-dependent reductase (Old Yellow Enzyme family)